MEKKKSEFIDLTLIYKNNSSEAKNNTSQVTKLHSYDIGMKSYMSLTMGKGRKRRTSSHSVFELQT